MTKNHVISSDCREFVWLCACVCSGLLIALLQSNTIIRRSVVDVFMVKLEQEEKEEEKSLRKIENYS